MGFFNNLKFLKKKKKEFSNDNDIKFETIVNEDYMNEINDILEREHIELLISAMTNKQDRTKIKKLLLEDKKLSRYVPEPKEKYAELISADIVGNGIIEEILEEYENVTDIGYNGKNVIVETSNDKFIYREGEISEEYINKIIQRFATREKKEFSYGNPQFNGYSNNIRISATHKELSPTGTSFALRITKADLVLNDVTFQSIAPDFIREFLQSCVLAKCNIFISGKTGTGKTELQKLLLSYIPFSEKMIMMEDINEVHASTLFPDKDIVSWITKGSVTLNKHVSQGLRFHPDWMIVSETRESEAFQVYKSLISGHKMITSLHSHTNQTVPSTYASMASMEYRFNEDLFKENFLEIVDIGIHMSVRKLNGVKHRYIDEIVEFNPKGNRVLFSQRVIPKENSFEKTYSSYQLTNSLNDKFEEEGVSFILPIHENKKEVVEIKGNK